MSLDLAPNSEAVLDSGNSATQGNAEVRPLGFSRTRLWFWGTRSVLSVLDQGLLSGSSFLLNVVLARCLTSEQYGAFAVCFAAFLFISGFHNVLVVEPMTVIGSSRYSQRLTEYFGGELRVHLVIAGALTSVTLLIGIGLAFYRSSGPLLPAIFALGISLPFILLLFLLRRMCYIMQNPSAAVQASGLYCLILVGTMAAFWRFRLITPAAAFLLIAFASLLSSVFVMQHLSIPASTLLGRGSLSLRRLLHENWEYAHWLVLTTALSWMLVQMQTFFTAGFLELSAAGALRAMQLPSLLMSQLIAATMLLLLPSMAQELGRNDLPRLHQKVVTVAAALSLLGLAFVATLYMVAVPLERILFGGKYSSMAWLIPVLGLAPVFTGLASGLSLALRALRKSKFELLAYMISAVMAMALALSLVPRWGLPGAAISVVGSTATLAVAVVSCYLIWGRASV